MPEILLIDDDVELCSLLKSYLEKRTFALDCLYSGDDAVSRLLGPKPCHYDLLLLDVTLPGRNGFEILKTIREHEPDIPVLMLTARGDPADRIAGLEAGADDYIGKPFDVRELAARIDAVLRRSGKMAADFRQDALQILRLEDLELNRPARAACIDGRELDLTETELKLLEVLLENKGQVVSLRELFRSVLGRPFLPGDRSLSTHISHLRNKLGPYRNGVQRIRTFRGRGFTYVTSGDRDTGDVWDEGDR